MAISTKSISRQTIRPVGRTVRHGADRPDLIEQEFLGLWLGISRLRERVLRDRDLKRASARKRTRRPPATSR